jgi:integrase
MAATALRTQDDVFALAKPTDGEAVYFDEGKPKDRAPGLALRIREAGSRKFVYFYRHGGRLRKHTIGDAAAWSLSKARQAARALRVQIDDGENPAIEKATQRAASALLFSAVKTDYLDVRRPQMKPRSLEECERHLNKAWKPLHGMALSAIDRATVAARLRTIAKDHGPVAADRARSTLSAMFGWAVGEGLCASNPVLGTNKASDDKPRERILSDPELVKIWNAAEPDTDYGRILRLLILSAQRRDEIGGLRWPEIMHADDPAKAHIALTADRTKNSRPHDIPLSDLAREIVSDCPKRDERDLMFGKGEGGYSGWSRSKAAFDERSGVANWVLHDLRRTAATRMADLGVQPHIIEAILNHVSGHKAGVAGIYNRSTYAIEKRAALDTWAAHLRIEIAKAEGGNVLKLKKVSK